MTARLIAFALTATLASPIASAAFAQSPLVMPVKMGQTVWVTTAEGFEIKGIVSEVTPASIVLGGEFGAKTLDWAQVRRIAKKDSNLTGFLIGSGVALVGTLFVASVTNELDYYYDSSNTSNTSSRRNRSGSFVGVFIIGSLFYGGIGALIDNAIPGRQTIWENRGATSVSISPILGRKSAGIGATISWK